MTVFIPVRDECSLVLIQIFQKNLILELEYVNAAALDYSKLKCKA